MRATRGNSNTAFTASLDAVSVTVDYTLPGTVTLTSDANGNLVARGADTFTYDQANRLISATVAGVTETYAYDGDGVRFSRTVGAGPAIRYVSDVNTSLPVTLDDGTRTYVWGLGLAYAVSGTSIEVYHADRLGSVRAITDATGAVTATYRTDEYGVPTATTGSSSQPFTFTGEPRDATGLSYLRARYYDPTLGRFTARDPSTGGTSAPSSLNRVGCVGNNPTSLTDHSGLCEDPGGTGLRYCVARYIPDASFCYPLGFCGYGDNRGPMAQGGSYRVEVLIKRDPGGGIAVETRLGTSFASTPLGPFSAPGLGACVSGVKSNALRTNISLLCRASSQLVGALTGPIVTSLLISESASGTAVSGYGTAYPNLEVWQYGGDNGPTLLTDFQTRYEDVPASVEVRR